jgi:membrane-bound metal-dependent hydrolase YbcI (DUF457 family)
MLAAAAVLPDAAEQAFRLFGTAAYVKLYHGPAHSLLGMALLAAVAALAYWRIEPSLAARFRFATLGVGSHLLLDLVHGWGVALLWPLSDARTGTRLMANYDLPALGIISLSLLGPALLNAVNREIGAPRVNARLVAWAALVVIAALIPARWAWRARCLATVNNAPLSEGAESASVYPSAILPWRWTAVEDTELAYLVGEVDGWTGARRPYLIRLAKPLPNNLLIGAQGSDTGQAFLRLATYPYYSLEEGRQAVRVRIRDVAFHSPGGSHRPFSVEIEVTSTMQVLSERAVF